MYIFFPLKKKTFLFQVYSCAYHGVSQGWMYISENYLCFYSFLLGIETKVIVELKDVRDLTKEKSKRGMVSDSIKVITKDDQEVRKFFFFFSFFFLKKFEKKVFI
jgi:hypothetical protein